MFSQNWEQLYLNSILKQGKWFASNHQLGIGDLVFIKYLKTNLLPTLARITAVEKHTNGTERYFVVSYKLKHGKGTKFKTVKREAQSLVLLMTQDEQNNDENLLRDSLDFLSVS